MAAAEQFTELQPPPHRQGAIDQSLIELFDWVHRYHMTLEPLVKDLMQRTAEIAALAELTQSITDPPTQAEVQAVQAKVNAIIAAAASTVET